MNYLELINKFWTCNNELPIGCNATALYFYLLKVCNSLGWRDTFKHSDRYIALQLGVSINTVRNSKNKLKQLGLIDFKSPEKSSRGVDGSTRYSFTTLSNNDSDTCSVPNTVVDTVIDSVPDTINKLNKTKVITLSNGDTRLIFSSLAPLLEELLTDGAVIEELIRYSGSPYPNENEISDRLKEFFAKLTVDGEETKTRKDAIYHFKNWIDGEKNKKGGKNERQSTNGVNNTRSVEQSEGKAPKDYSGNF